MANRVRVLEPADGFEPPTCRLQKAIESDPLGFLIEPVDSEDIDTEAFGRRPKEFSVFSWGEVPPQCFILGLFSAFVENV